MEKRKSSKNPVGWLVQLKLLLVFMAFVLGGGMIWQGYKEVGKAKFLGEKHLNFVVIQENPVLISSDPINKSLAAIHFSGETYVPVSYGYGENRLKNVFAIGELDKRGGVTLTSTIANLFGVPVDGYIKFNSGNILNDTGSTKDFLLSFLSWKNGVSSNLNVIDFGKLVFETTQLRFDKMKNINLDKNGVYDDLVLADGSVAKSLDQAKAYYLYKDLFLEKAITDDNLKVEILNSGKSQGLGNLAAKILGSIGFDVVMVGNLEGSANGGCEIKADKQFIKSNSVLRMAALFGCLIKPKDPGRTEIILTISKIAGKD